MFEKIEIYLSTNAEYAWADKTDDGNVFDFSADF